MKNNIGKIVLFVALGLGLLIGGVLVGVGISKLGTKTYQVTFVSNGGSKVMSQNVKDGDTVSRPTEPEKEGYAFIAWLYNGEVFDFNTKINKDIELSADWTEFGANHFKITFDSNGGSTVANQVLKEDGELDLSVVPTKKGAIFVGWYYNNELVTEDTVLPKNATLKAVWKQDPNMPTGTATPNGKVVYGDADRDGKVTVTDATVVEQHILGVSKLSGQALKNADINGDGKVNSVDTVLIQGYVARYFEHNTSKALTNYVLYGDANNDGKINVADRTAIQAHVQNVGKLSGQSLKNADINNDGKITGADEALVAGYIAGYCKHNIYAPLTGAKLYGDANVDGVVNVADRTSIQNHVKGTAKLTGLGLAYADVNADGVVNTADEVLIGGYLAKYYGHNIYSPLKDARLYGDANVDGDVDVKDKTAIQKYILGTSKLTAQGKQNADINSDGKINKVDEALITGVSLRYYKDFNIYKPISSYILYGDVNQDGRVTIQDATQIQKYLAGTSRLIGQALKNADVNADGKITNDDAISIQKYLSGSYYYASNALPYQPFK